MAVPKSLKDPLFLIIFVFCVVLGFFGLFESQKPVPPPPHRAVIIGPVIDTENKIEAKRWKDILFALRMAEARRTLLSLPPGNVAPDDMKDIVGDSEELIANIKKRLPQEDYSKVTVDGNPVTDEYLDNLQLVGYRWYMITNQRNIANNNGDPDRLAEIAAELRQKIENLEQKKLKQTTTAPS
jgi:hypothetical protein